MYKTRLQRNGQTLRLTAELRALGLSVIAHPEFTQILHVMHVEPHHVSQPVRIEQSMCTLAHGVFGISLHQPESFQTFDHHTCRQVVYIHIRNTRTKCFHRLQVHGVLYLVNLALAPGKLFIGRNGRRHIACITHLRFCAGIDQEQIARLDDIAMIMVVERLSVHRSDGSKRKVTPCGMRHGFHGCRYFPLAHPGTQDLHGRNVHIRRNVAGLLDFDNLLGRLVVTLRDHRTDKRHRTLLTRGRHSQPVHQLQFMLCTVGRQVMDGLSLLYRLVQIAHNVGRRHGDVHSHPLTLFLQCGLSPHPYDMIDGQFITEYNFLIFINVDYSRKPGKRKAEVVEKGRILTIAERIVLVVQSTLVVSQKQQYSGA